jgi:CRP-like cAMP-binding protein
VTIDGFPVSRLGPGQSFGEKALLRDTPRSATVAALETTTLWYMDGSDFIAAATGSEGHVVQRVHRLGGATVEDMLAAVPLFAAIDRRELAQLGETRTLAAAETIVGEGEPGHRFYVLLEGEASVTIAADVVRTLMPGDWFGEIALLHDVRRTATVAAVGVVTVWSLERDVFLRVLGASSTVRHPAQQPGAGGASPEPAGTGLIV